MRLDPAMAQRLLNARRAEGGLGPVRLDPTLTAMAQRQADAMAAANTLSHDVAGSFARRIEDAGIAGARTAENLAGGSYSTQDAIEGWRRSPSHDANLMMPQATRCGIALAKDGQTQYRTWWALVIASDPEPRRELAAGPAGYFGSNRPR